MKRCAYLHDLEEKGAAIVLSIWRDDIDVAEIPQWFDTFNGDKLVIKPDNGGNATDTFVRDTADNFLLMELEMIEPSLYLRTDDGAAGRFAAAFDNHVKDVT